ncbi:MAG TPA: RraA family protein [Bryobacterales bacterium]|nr:RraA family protein [Bryobacterales bacterium]
MTRKRLLLLIALLLAVVLFWPTDSNHTMAKTGDPLVDGFLMVEVASVADAVEQVLGQRAHMSSDIQPVFPAKIAGPAVTVKFRKEEHKDGSKDFQGALDAIDNAPPGSIYVITFEDGKDVAGIGGLMGTAMKVRGLAGAIVDAGVRDTPQLRKIQFPTFGGRPVPSTSVNHYRFAGSNIEIMCAGVKVRPSDIIVADEDGVAVVPRDHAKQILDKAIENDQTEHAMYPFIAKFKSIKKAVAEFGRI